MSKNSRLTRRGTLKAAGSACLAAFGVGTANALPSTDRERPKVAYAKAKIRETAADYELLGEPDRLEWYDGRPIGDTDMTYSGIEAVWTHDDPGLDADGVVRTRGSLTEFAITEAYEGRMPEQFDRTVRRADRMHRETLAEHGIEVPDNE